MTIFWVSNVPVSLSATGNGASNSVLDGKADRFADGTPLETKLSKYEKYFDNGKYRFYANLRDGASLYRSDKNAANKIRLVDAACEIVGVDNDYVYYINCSDEYKLYRIDASGKHNGKLVDKSVESAELKGGRIYFYSISNGVEYFSFDRNGKNLKKEKTEIEIRDGDWTVDGNQTVEGKTISLSGNLNVMQGAALTLKNCRLIFNTGSPGQPVIERKFSAGEGTNVIIDHSSIQSTNPMCGILTDFHGMQLKVDHSRLAGFNGGLRLSNCDNPVITGNLFYNRMEYNCVSADWAAGLLVKDNIMIMPSRTDEYPPINICIGISHCTDSKVTDNVLVRQQEVIYVFTGSNNNIISGNMILGDEFFAGLSVRHDAGNNILEGNFIQAYYNNGYNQYARDRWNFGIYYDTCISSNIFRNNTIVNCWTGIGARYVSNSVFDSNRITSGMKRKPDGDVEPLLGIESIRSYNNQFINNTFEGVDGDGAMFLASPDNRLAGNSFRGYNYGLGFWYGSDSNTIQDNLLENNTVGIVTDKTDKNAFTGNTFKQGSRYQSFAYDSGTNRWTGNFWGKKQTGAYRIPGGGKDEKPLGAAPKTVAFKSSGYAKEYTEPADTTSYYRLNVTDHMIIKDKTEDFKYYAIVVEKGGTLELRNATLQCTKFRNQEPDVEIRPGGTLIMEGSRILAGEKDIYVAITAYNESNITIRNSTFKNLLGFGVQCNGAVIERSNFDGCFQALTVYGQNCTVSDCTFSNCYSGLRVGGWGSTFRNNKTYNSIVDFILPTAR
jgi:parallel beta-helix repeat protein